MTKEQKHNGQGKNYGNKCVGWSTTLSKKTAHSILRSVEKTERQRSKREISSILENNQEEIGEN